MHSYFHKYLNKIINVNYFMCFIVIFINIWLANEWEQWSIIYNYIYENAA